MSLWTNPKLLDLNSEFAQQLKLAADNFNSMTEEEKKQFVISIEIKAKEMIKPLHGIDIINEETL